MSRIQLHLARPPVVLLAFFFAWSVGVAHSQTLTIHNLSPTKVAFYEIEPGTDDAKQNPAVTVESGTQGQFQAFAGIPWRIKVGLKTVGRYLTKDMEQQDIYVTQDGIFQIGDEIILFESKWNQWKLYFDVGNTAYLRNGRGGKGFSFERLDGSMRPPVATFSKSTAWVPQVTQSGALKFTSATNPVETLESRPRGMRFSEFRIIRAYDAWLKISQPPTRLKGQGELSGQSLDEGFVGSLVSIDHHCRYGYNVLKLNPFKLQQRGILDGFPGVFAEYDPRKTGTYYYRAGFRIPKNMLYTDVNEGQELSNESTYLNRQEVSEGFSVSVGLKGGVGEKSKVGVEGSYDSQHSKMSANNYALTVGTKWSSHMWLTWDKQMLHLNSRFVRHLLEMDETEKAYRRLFEMFGTHYALSSLFGGRAVLETSYEMSTVAESVSEQYGTKISVEAKTKKGSGGGNVGLSWSNSQKDLSRKSAKSSEFHRAGGLGGTFESWSKGEAKDWVPIKVDLRPIYEVIRPELVQRALTVDQTKKLNRIRAKLREALRGYLKAVEVDTAAALQPALYEVRLVHAECTKSFDSGHPDITGYIYARLEGPSGGTLRKPIIRGKNWEVMHFQEKETTKKILGEKTITAAFAPVVKPTNFKGQTIYKQTLSEDEYFFYPNWDLTDHDSIGADERMVTGRMPKLALSQLLKERRRTERLTPPRADLQNYVIVEVLEGSTKSFATVRFTQDREDFGRMQFDFQIRRLNYHLRNDEDTLPDFPKFNF